MPSGGGQKGKAHGARVATEGTKGKPTREKWLKNNPERPLSSRGPEREEMVGASSLPAAGREGMDESTGRRTVPSL